jgi:5-methylcytosine-specific restriction endonuclease McrA
MLLKGKAEKVEEDGKIFHTTNAAYRLPTVIRLHRYIRIASFGGVVFSKKNVFRRDNFSCQYCGHHGSELTIDHVIPKSRGGTTSWHNVVVACKRCNLRKGNRTIEETGLVLRRKPFRPRFLLNHLASRSVPESFLRSWNKYLTPQIAYAAE